MRSFDVLRSSAAAQEGGEAMRSERIFGSHPAEEGQRSSLGMWEGAMEQRDLPRYQLRTFGGLALTAGGVSRVPGARVSRRGLALLALLSVAGERGMSRDKLMTFLWPESDAERARHSLNQTLYALRRDLCDEVILQGNAELRLNEAVIETDFAAFQNAIANNELERAVSLYSGAFLDGFFLDDASEFERWLESERARASASYSRALETLASSAAEAGRSAAAVDYWRRLAETDPLNERLAHQLMVALSKSGQRSEAIRHGESFCALVREELDVDPDRSLIALLDCLRSERPQSLRGQTDAQVPEVGQAISQYRAQQPAEGQFVETHPRLSDPSRRNSWSFLTSQELRRRRRRIAIVGTLFGVSLGIASAWLLHYRLSQTPTARRVLVTTFANATGDAQFDLLGLMTADWIIDGLARSQLVDVVDAPTSLFASGASTDGRIRETPLSTRELAEYTGATLVITGSYQLQRGAIRMDATIRDARTGETIRRVAPILITQWQLAAGVAAIRQRVIVALAGLVNPALLEWASASTAPPSYDAYREYLLGVDQLWTDWGAAAGHFQRAIRLDSTFGRALVQLVDTYLLMDDRQKADSVAREVADHSELLGPSDRYFLQYLRARLHGDMEAEYESAMLALEAMPGSPVAQRRAGYAAVDANHPQRAVELLSRLDPRLGDCRDCEHYWWDLTSAEHMLGEYQQELADAERGIRQYPSLLNMRYDAIRALAALGRVEEVQQRLDAALALHANGWFNQLSLFNSTVGELRAHGQPETAERLLRRGLAWYASLPLESKRGGTYDFAYASSLYLAHRWREAETVFQRVASLHPGNGFYAGFVAAAAFQAGDDQVARQILGKLEKATVVNGPGGDKRWVARLIAMRGDRERAVTLLRETFREGQEYNVSLHTEPYLDSLRGFKPFEELMRPRG